MLKIFFARRCCNPETGFSLIELMVVVGIIGILATIAIPFYQNYSHKAKFTEIIQAVAPFKLAVEACAHEQGSLAPCVNAGDGDGQNGIPPAISNTDDMKSYVKSVSVSSRGADSAAITATSQHIGKDNTTYTYILDAILQDTGQIIWTKDPQSTCASAGLC